MRFKLWFIILLTVGAIFIDLPKLPFIPQDLTIPYLNVGVSNLVGFFPLKLGLDLQGGTQLVLETQMDKIPEPDRDQALASATEVIERRVNLFGVSESIVQSSKVGSKRRILVDLPGIKDASAAADLVGKTAQLEFKELIASPSAVSQAASDSATPFDFSNNFQSTGLTGADLKKAQVTYSQGSRSQTGPQIAIEFTSEGAKKFAEITKRNIGKPLAIFLDNEFISAPNVEAEIIGGNGVISGSYTPEDAKKFATQLNAGALPVPIKIVEQRSVGASLGAESVNKSLFAGAIGLVIVMLYMAFYYGRLGLVADFALIVYSILVLAIFKTGLFLIPPITLTLSGIAGFILSVGMAVDANILIFERMKEERRWGKTNKQALELGFNRAWSSIRDSNISSLITAGILYFMGTGLVRGFAVTLAIGVLVSMFTAITVTRTILKIFIKN